MQQVLDAALEEGRAARTVVEVHHILHAAFRSAVRWQALAANPSDGVTPPKVEQARLRTPKPEDFRQLLARIANEYRAPLAVAAMTGLRRGETLALRWEDVDLDEARPVLNVTGSLQRGSDGLVVLPPKTERSRRRFPLAPSIATMLRKVRNEQLERRMKAGPA